MAQRAPADSAASDDAFRALLLRRIPEAHRLAAWILRDPTGAEDAVQEAAMQAWLRRGQLRDPAAAEIWFTRIVVNVCRDEMRRRSKRRALPEAPSEAGEVEPGPAERIAERDRIARAVSRLNPDEQVVVVLRFVRDMTVPAIAAATGLPEGTVKSRLHHAQEHLRAAFDAERRAELQTEEADR